MELTEGMFVSFTFNQGTEKGVGAVGKWDDSGKFYVRFITEQCVVTYISPDFITEWKEINF